MTELEIKAIIEGLIRYFEYDGIGPESNAYGDTYDYTTLQKEIDEKVNAINKIALEVLEWKKI